MRRFSRSLSGGMSSNSRDCSREFLFKRAIQQNAAKFCHSTSSNDSLLRPQNSEEVAVELLDSSQSSMSGDRIILLGFIGAENEPDSDVNDDFTSYAYNEFKHKDSSLDKALAQCNRIRQKPAFNQGLLLKSVEQNPMFNFLHYAIFNSNPSNDRRSSVFGEDVSQIETNSSFGQYEELFAIQKSSTFIEPSTLPTHRYSGYIVSNFKIMDRSRQQQLEKNWLYWSGAKEIYRYSPRNWNLRKISLLRLTSGESFNFVLLCEFGQILHPANILLGLDMCERLRGRVCGNFNLYRIQHSYYANETPKATGFCTNNQPDIVVSPAHSLANSIARPPVMTNMPRLASPSKISRMGVSQDVDTANDANSRRMNLSRMRDRSLGYETRFHSNYMFEEFT